jgi:hypothetical protein
MNKMKPFALTIVFTVVLALLFSMSNPAIGAAPPNDDIYSATEVMALPFDEIIETTQAKTSRYDLPSCSYEPAVTVWYKFTPAKTSYVRFSSVGSDYPTLFTVYTGIVEKRNVNLIEEYCTTFNQFDIALNAGTTYYIRVSSYTGGPYAEPSPVATGGILHLNITQLTGPENDDFANAKTIDMSVNQSYYDGNNDTYATVEIGEPTPSCNSGKYRTLWYAYTPTQNGKVTGNFGGYYSFLAVYTGSSLDSLTSIWCRNYGGSVDFSVVSGTTYYLQLGEMFDWSSGWASLNFSLIQPPSNDDFLNAKSFNLDESTPFSDGLDDNYATIEAIEPYPSCAWGRFRTVWYTFTPSTSGSVSGNYGGNTPFMAVYTGSGASGLTQVECSSYGGGVNFTVEGGITYYIQLGEMDSWYSGWLSIYLTFSLPPANDNFLNAETIILDGNMPFSVEREITSATAEIHEPNPGCSYSVNRTIWFTFTPSANGRVSGSYGGNGPFLGVYTGSSLDGLNSIWCSSWGGGVDFAVSSGTTYYIQLGMNYEWLTGLVSLSLSFTTAPPNDNFANAMLISTLPYEGPINIFAATSEMGELRPSCVGDPYRTVWYSFTPGLVKAFTAEASYSWWWSFMAVYKEDSPGVFTEVRCRNDYWGGNLTFLSEAGKTYYLQLGSSNPNDNGEVYFKLMETPPPSVSFSYWPSDPTIYENVSFYNNSYDPYGLGISATHWDFGDGTTSLDWNPAHRYLKDGDYTVNLEEYTTDGRFASNTQTVAVRTHDVAITKFTVPQSAAVNQSRTITVGLRNTRYPETVTVDLYVSTPNGWQFVGTTTQSVPIRPSNRTIDFLFKYTFTNADAVLGKVTFRAVATIQGVRDALPLDNEAISLPVKVTK